MDFGEILQGIAQWVWTLILGVGNLIGFLFRPLSQSISGMSLPDWVSTALNWLIGIVGNNVSPIAMIGVTGIVVATIIGIIKAFI